MNQPHDAIRPRRRRRQPMAANNPAIARAEQSTQILIRIPAVAGAEAASASAGPRGAQQGAASPERTATKEPRKELGTATSGLRALLNETTSKKGSGSQRIDQAETTAARSLHVEIPNKTAPEAIVKKVGTAADVSTSSAAHSPQYRLDAAHPETAGPHSAADAWQGGERLLENLLKVRSLLAVALIIAGVISAAIVLRNRTQHHALRPDGDPAANASQTDPKGTTPFPKAATSATGQPMKQSLAGNQPPVSAAANAAANSAGDTRGANPAAPNRWNAPAGANLPASVAPISIEQPSNTPNTQNINQDPFYSAQRVDPPAGAVNYRFSESGGAAFEGNINNPVQLSR